MARSKGRKAVLSSNSKILVIRLSAMGDVAMVVPVLVMAKRQYPDLQVTVVTKPSYTPIFRQISGISVFTADTKGRHSGFLGLIRLYRDLRKQNFQAVADLHNVLRSRVLKLFFSFGSVTWRTMDKGRAAKKEITRWSEKEIRPLKSTIERYLEVFERLGLNIQYENNAFISQSPMPSKYRDKTKGPGMKSIGIAPFAAHPGKAYGRSQMKAVLKKLSDSGDYVIYLFGGPGAEAEVLETWSKKFPNTINIAGKGDLQDELALISNLDLMVSMDSANGHLAAIYGVPVIGLWGVTHPYVGFYPYSQDPGNALLADREAYPYIPTSVFGNKYPKGYERAINSISPDVVYEKIKGLQKNETS